MTASTGSLDGIRALVTGAGAGIGRAIAHELASRGARVVVHHRGSAGIEATLQVLDGRGVAVRADLSSAAACRELMDAATSALGGLDVLVNNAGVPTHAPLAQLTLEQIDELLAVNLRAPMLLTQAALPHLRASGRGSIVTISSIHGHGGAALYSVYAATKGGVNAFTRSLAVELAADGIRVNSISPGVIEVERYFDDPAYQSGDAATAVPLGRVGTGADVAAAVAFLASDEAGFITGTDIVVDGGTRSMLAL